MLDAEELYKLIINDPDLQNVPIFTIMLVATAVIKAINSGKCFLVWED